MQIVSQVSDALSPIHSGHQVFVHGAAATPNTLLEGLVQERARLKDVELIHLHTMGPALVAEPHCHQSFRVTNLFVGANMRGKLHDRQNDYVPCFLSEIPALFRKRIRRVDVALIHVSPPDAHGYCTLGTSVDVAHAAVEMAEIVIAQINPQMPRVHGDGFVHVSQIDHAIEVNEPLPEHPRPELDDVHLAIGRNVAELVADGATLQMGIGAVPDAALAALRDHKRLGVHTEMWSDGTLDLIRNGVIDNSQKKIHPGKTVSGFIIGTKEVYDFINDNPAMVQLDIAYVNQPNVIARNPKVTAINSCVEIDLSGQVCSDSVGYRIISGVGGQMDFLRAAALSEDGRPILALPSRTKKGQSRIVQQLRPGAGVVTTRAHVHWVVTEYGRVNLFGRTLEERADLLCSIAHPEDREGLLRAWHERQTLG